MAGFASLGDLKEHLNISSAASDSELLLMLDAANEVVSSMVGDLDGSTVTERVVVPYGGTVILSGRPVSNVQLNGGAVSGFTVNSAAGLLYNVGVTGPATVTYTVGGGSTPSAVVLATLIIAAHLWETQRGATPVGPLATADDTALTPGLGFAIPNRARELLEPFVGSSAQIA
jgi:hypothetical protein